MEQVWLTASEIAQLFKIKVPTVRLWTRQGMPHLKCGGRLVRFDASKVQKWLEQKQNIRSEEKETLR
jgi:excisionase family DNA binding protein